MVWNQQNKGTLVRNWDDSASPDPRPDPFYGAGGPERGSDWNRHERTEVDKGWNNCGDSPPSWNNP